MTYSSFENNKYSTIHSAKLDVQNKKCRIPFEQQSMCRCLYLWRVLRDPKQILVIVFYCVSTRFPERRQHHQFYQSATIHKSREHKKENYTHLVALRRWNKNIYTGLPLFIKSKEYAKHFCNLSKRFNWKSVHYFSKHMQSNYWGGNWIQRLWLVFHIGLGLLVGLDTFPPLSIHDSIHLNVQEPLWTILINSKAI